MSECELTSADCPDRVDADAAWSGSVPSSMYVLTVPVALVNLLLR